MKHLLLIAFFITSGTIIAQSPIKVLDTDFSKGKLCNQQQIDIGDVVKFHGHLCDGLVVGYLGLKAALYKIFPDSIIDRTSLRIISKSSPCLTDVSIYLSGARYQFSSFYVSDSIDYLMIVGTSDTGKYFGFNLKPGIKPKAIDSLGNLAIQGKLDACGLEELRKLENTFTNDLLNLSVADIFIIDEFQNFEWNPVLIGDFKKTDILNKSPVKCIH